ncbi:MAG TPA: ribosomal protein S18-alanine N-acetyltransferase [Devosia sp.]|nr:ribosomal protein S18-alanine N-acetyltransferase [Devosia sp.]
MMVRSWMAPLGLHIEPARPADAEAVARLHAQSFYRGWPRQDIEAYIIDPDTPTLVACDARRRLAGFAMLRILGDDAELMTIAVDPKYRGKGVGAALMRACFEDLLMTPSKRMILEVAADNPAAIRLYRNLGFEKISERQGYYARPDGKPATALVMARNLE